MVSALSGDEFAARLLERSRARKLAASSPEPDERAAYRRAAALLTGFDPRQLRLPGETATGRAVALLVDDSVSIASAGELRWRLRGSVRTDALRSFSSAAQAREHLEANLDHALPDTTPWVALALLQGRTLDLEPMSIEDLGRVRRAVSWLRLLPDVGDLPTDAEVDRRLEWARLLEPLRLLLRLPFEGREEELGVLADHLALAPRPLSHRIARSVVARRLRPDYPLVIHGPGGIGKSTLIARSLVDHLDDDRVPVFPFVFVDAERASVNLEEPLSLVAEMIRQLSLQLPGHREELLELGRQARAIAREQRERQSELDDLRQGATTRTIGRDVAWLHHSSSRTEESALVSRLGDVLARAVGPDGASFVVALDSFEEAQYRSSPLLDRMWAMLGALRESFPRTRVVVAGRAPVGHPDIDVDAVPTIELVDLDPAAAHRFLVDREVPPDLAPAIVERIGGNPLNLQLAAKVVARLAATRSPEESGADWVADLPTRRRRIFKYVDDMLIQGMLYDRVLLHIADPDVRRLAHPGLALRRITPDLIEQVLAPHSGVALDGPEHAHRLYLELARELDLVDQVAPWVLRHRADVRKVMLRLLKVDRAREVEAVERAAVDYYARRDTVEDRCEEVYHRLRLGDDLALVRTRWRPEIGPGLASAVDELPHRSARLLTRLLEGTLAAGDEDQQHREHRVAAEADDLLTQGFAHQALELVEAERPWIPGGPLQPLHVEVLLRLGRTTDARASIDAALDEPGADQQGAAYLELLLLSARLAAEAGDVETADSELELAEAAARALGNDLETLGVLLQRVRLRDLRADGGDVPGSTQVRGALTQLVRRVSDAVLAQRPALYRAVAAEVAEQEPDVLAHAVDLVGLPALSRETLHSLAGAIAEGLDSPGVVSALAEAAGEEPEGWAGAGPDDVERVLRTSATAGRLEPLVRDLVAADDPSGQVRHGVASVMHEVIDAAAYPAPKPAPKPPGGPRA